MLGASNACELGKCGDVAFTLMARTWGGKGSFTTTASGRGEHCLVHTRGWHTPPRAARGSLPPLSQHFIFFIHSKQLCGVTRSSARPCRRQLRVRVRHCRQELQTSPGRGVEWHCRGVQPRGGVASANGHLVTKWVQMGTLSRSPPNRNLQDKLRRTGCPSPTSDPNGAA